MKKNKFKNKTVILGIIGAFLLGYFMGDKFGIVGIVGGVGTIFLFSAIINEIRGEK